MDGWMPESPKISITHQPGLPIEYVDQHFIKCCTMIDGSITMDEQRKGDGD